MRTSRRLFVPLLAGAAALGVTAPVSGASGASARSAKPCDVPSATPLGTGRNYLRTIYESADVTVIEHVVAKPIDGKSDVVSLAYKSCSRTTGHEILIYQGSPGTGPFPSIGFDARGNWLVVGHHIGSGVLTVDSGTIRSLNARTGQRGPVVDQNGGIVPGADGLIPDVGQAYTQLAIASDGQFAWVSDLPATAGSLPPVTTGLFAPEGRDGDRAVDPEAPSAITDLTVHGQTITWVVGGKTKSATLR
jgi:hypothetical protein